MASTFLFYVQYTAANLSKAVYYDSIGGSRTIRVELERLNPAQPYEADLATDPPADGWPFAQGEVVLDSCEDYDQVVVYFEQSSPYAQIAVNAGAEKCSVIVVPPGNPPPTGGGPTSFDNFTSNNTGVSLFYEVDPYDQRRVTTRLSPENGIVETTVSEADRGRVKGELITSFVEGSSTVRLLASLEFPFATIEVVPIVVNPEPVRGCMDPSATNYNPDATEDDGTCTYDPDPEPEPLPEPIWGGIPVAVTPETEDTPAFVEAELYAGFWEGHSLAQSRPLAFVSGLRATWASMERRPST